MNKIYLAGPLFTLAERTFNKELGIKLRELGYDVWVPQENEPRELTAPAIYDKDIEGVEWCDTVVACMDGPDPDSGTAYECGYARRAGKTVVCYRTDFRACGDIGGANYNLMLWSGSHYNLQVPMDYTVSMTAAALRGVLAGLGKLPNPRYKV